MGIRRTKKERRKTTKRKSGMLIARVVLSIIMASILWVVIYRFVNPPYTWLMAKRILSVDQSASLPPRAWMSYPELSENLKRAVIAAEDAHFMTHAGFDTQAIKQAYQKNKAGKPLSGGSTISQQTAKNVFLWPGRSWLRKGLEAWFTLLIEAFWGKKRILEVYLNVIEMGNGIYGAEQACRYYFKKSAGALTKRQAALLAAILPNPRKWTPNKPTPFINRKTGKIIRYMPYSKIP